MPHIKVERAGSLAARASSIPPTLAPTRSSDESLESPRWISLEAFSSGRDALGEADEAARVEKQSRRER